MDRTGNTIPARKRAALACYARRQQANVQARLHDPATRIVTAGLLGVAGLLVVGLLFWYVLLLDVPSTEELEGARYAEASVAYTADGQELTRYRTQHRIWVPYDRISPYVIDALVATEDRRFYEHSGIDVMRTAGALLRTASGDRQGGSTITMQLARNAFPDFREDFVLKRKIKEWITALRIESLYDKEEILEIYLNTVPFLYNAFGIEAGAQTYFQKSAQELNLIESATLVGMLKGTVFYNPYRNPENAHARRNVVLGQMVKNGYLEEAEMERVRDKETPLRFKRVTFQPNLAPFFAEYVRQQLDEWADEHGYNLYTDGLRVYTTLDAQLQAAAERAVQRTGDDLQAVVDVEWSESSPPFSSSAESYHYYRKRRTPFAHFWKEHPELLASLVERTPRFNALREHGLAADSARALLLSDEAFTDSFKAVQQRLEMGFVAIDPATGHIKAYVGGRNFEEAEFDHVALARRQPGSTFKPFLYAAAMEQGFTPNSTLRDAVREYQDPHTGRRWRPQNAGASTGELMTLRQALAHSKNTISAQLILDVGPQRVVELAHRAGIQSELQEVPSLALGTSPVTLLELAAAYGTLASQGHHREPVAITRIEDRNGRVLDVFATMEEEALSQEAAYGVLDMMRGVVSYGTGSRIRWQYGARGDLAGKTGTTQNSADGWFMLMHPSLVMGAWTGFDNPALTFRSDYWGQGAHNALRVVGAFYQEAVRQQPEALSRTAAFEAPPGYRRWAERVTPRDSVAAVAEADSLTRARRNDTQVGEALEQLRRDKR